MKTKLNELLTKLIILCSLIMLAFTDEIGISISKYCLYLIVGFCIIKIAFLRLQVSQFIALLIVFFSCVGTAIFYNENPANNLIFFTSLILAVLFARFGIEESVWKLLRYAAVIASLWFFYQYLSANTVDIAGRLILCFNNPNMAGIALCAPSSILVLMIADEKKKLARLLYTVLLAAMIYLVYLTENRGSFFTLIAFAVCALLAMLKKNPWRMTSNVVYAILKLMPILVMLVYVFLYTVLPSDLRLMDKPFFSGREYAWKIALEQLVRNPFARQSFAEGTLNLFLEGTRRYGIFSMIGFFWLLFTFKKQDLDTTNIRNYLAFLGFHLFLFQQSFESTLITGAFSVYVWNYVLLGIASMNVAEQPEQQSYNSGQKLPSPTGRPL